MKNLNNYINEAWSGMKQHSLKSDIEAWCKDMGIKRCTINAKGEIDVEGNVNLNKSNFKELPYKFGRVDGYFDIGSNPNLTSLKNCPDKVVGDYFSCSECTKLESLVGCPSYVGWNFYCSDCKRKFTEEEVMFWCKVKKHILV